MEQKHNQQRSSQEEMKTLLKETSEQLEASSITKTRSKTPSKTAQDYEAELSDEQRMKNQEYFKKVQRRVQMEEDGSSMDLTELYSRYHARWQQIFPHQKIQFKGNSRKILIDVLAYFTDYHDEYKMGNKGIGLMGPVGCGKTIMMKILQRNDRQYYHVATALEISILYQENGLSEIQKLITVPSLCIDDIGTGEETSHYGSKKDAVRYILQSRLDAHRITHWTTNYTTIQLFERFGERLYSRLKGQSEIFTFDSDIPDFRLQKS